MVAGLTIARMSAAATQRALLLAHPDGTGEAVWSVTAEVQLAPAASLLCHYALHGDLAHVRVPAARAGRRADGLWQHTCCEVFVAAEGATGYYEFNFSPALDWAAYRFEDYRAGMTAAAVSQAPGLQVRRTSSVLELTATVHLAGLGPLCGARALRVALAAVIEEDDGRRAYWALQHAPGRPDFHHPDSFALELRAA
jgi:hypothetical protein